MLIDTRQEGEHMGSTHGCSMCMCVGVCAQFRQRNYCLIIWEGFRKPRDGFTFLESNDLEANYQLFLIILLTAAFSNICYMWCSVCVFLWCYLTQTSFAAKKKSTFHPQKLQQLSTQHHSYSLQNRSNNPQVFFSVLKTEVRLDWRFRVSQTTSSYYSGKSGKAWPGSKTNYFKPHCPTACDPVARHIWVTTEWLSDREKPQCAAVQVWFETSMVFHTTHSSPLSLNNSPVAW